MESLLPRAQDTDGTQVVPAKSKFLALGHDCSLMKGDEGKSESSTETGKLRETGKAEKVKRR